LIINEQEVFSLPYVKSKKYFYYFLQNLFLYQFKLFNKTGIIYQKITKIYPKFAHPKFKFAQ